MGRITVIVMMIVMGSITPGEYVDDIRAAVENPARSDEDVRRDKSRKPAEVLDFFGMRPGMKVVDIFAGGGYYTEIVSYLVGKDGEVTLYNNGSWSQYVKDRLTERLDKGRLPNVNSLLMEANELNLNPEYYDAALFILGFHDLYYVDYANNWVAINVDYFLGAIYKGLKPGGVLGIVDHRSIEGASKASAQQLHRIDPGIIINDLNRAGFVLEARSPILENSDDDRTLPMSDESIRGRTDRVVLRFRKPDRSAITP